MASQLQCSAQRQNNIIVEKKKVKLNNVCSIKRALESNTYWLHQSTKVQETPKQIFYHFSGLHALSEMHISMMTGK